MAGSSQKFIARNRAPRVQIEYDVELYGAEKKVQLPFVMGVLSDLSGKSLAEPPAVADRRFLEIDADNFDDRMKAMAPRAAFSVPNTLTGEGQLSVDLTFEKMADFTPAALARKVAPLRALLEARERLAHLATYMDGKVGAEALIERLLADPAALASLAATLPEAAEGETAEALATLRDAMPEDAPEDDGSATLDALRAAAPAEVVEADTAGDVLAGIARVEETAEVDRTGDVLAGIERAEDMVEEDDAGDVLAGIARAEDAPEVDDRDDVLSRIERREEASASDEAGDVLGRMERRAEAPVSDDAGDVLGRMERATDAVPEREGAGDVLAGIERAEEAEEADERGDVLAGLERREAAAEADEASAVLEGLERVPDVPAAGAEAEGILAGVERAGEAAEPDDRGDVLAGMQRVEEDDRPDDSAETPAGLAEESPEDDGDDLAGLGGEDGAAGAEEDDDLAALMAELADDDDSEAEDPELAALMAGLDDDAGEGEDDPAPSTVEDEGEAAGLLAEGTAEAEVASDEEDAELAALMAGLDEDDEDDEEDPEFAALMAGLDEEESDDGDEADGLLAEHTEEAEDESDEDAELAALMAGLDDDDDSEGEEDPELAALMAGLDDDDGEEGEDPDLAALMAGLDDESEGGDDGDAELSALMAGLDDEDEAGDDDELSALMAGLDGDGDSGEDDELEKLMAGLDDDEGGAGDDELDSLMAGLDDDEAGAGDGELDALMAGLDGDGSGNAEGSGAEAQDLTLSDEAEHAFGTMGAARPEPAKLERQRFRIALFGDFSGRAARGLLETGEALAAREGVVLDCDSVEEIIEGFATTLVLPLGKDGQGMEVPLKELDDLHPDELYEKLPIFAELKGLRQQLGSAATAQGAAEKLRHWGEEHGVAVRPPQRHSAANTVRADLRLSDFEKLIGATAPGPRASASPVEDLLARVVGPHVRKAQGEDAAAMQKAVDEALSAAMRMVLHHPDFQAIEAQWRTLDLIARSIETDDSLEVMLYDLSAEEIAADIAAHDVLSQSGLARLLTEKPLDEENGRGAFSVLIGLYTFEETPPHAELLGRIARIAAHVDAPFVTAITPDFIDTKMEDRHRLVAEAWDTLRAMPEARHLGLVSPRFLLRRPYGEKSEPIYEFDFEEFTMAEGLSGMLWANPAVLPAILMAQSFRRNGMGLQLGSVMSLGGMPYHFVTDRHGDQVALPCTERNFSVDKHTAAVRRGYMPVLSVKGRDEVRLGSFNAVAGEELLGPWSKVPPPPPSPPKPPRPAPAPAAEAEDDDDLAGFGGDSDDDDLDALLAGFNDSSDDDDDGDGDLDAELAALLNDL